MLRENKRLRTQADKYILKQFKEYIFNGDIPIIDTIQKYSKFANQVVTTNNIAYRNSTCENVAMTVRKTLRKRYDYEVNEVLVCRKYLKLKGGKCSVNFEYIIKAINGNTLTIEDLSSNKSIDLKKDIIKNILSIVIVERVTHSKDHLLTTK